MTKALLTIALGASISLSCFAVGNLPAKAAASVKQRMAERVTAMSPTPQQQRTWRKAANASPMLKAPQAAPMSRTVGNTDYDGINTDFNKFGLLYTPSGETWTYTSNETYDSETGSLTGAKFTIYDADMDKHADLEISLTLGENETSINLIEMAPTLSRKFFNFDDEYEVMIYVHATTADYTGHQYTNAYSLKDGSLITTIEGNNIGAFDLAKDAWSEKYTMAFMREETGYDEDGLMTSYDLYFDIYTAVTWDNPTATKAHTFYVDYNNFAGAGNYALPILINNFGDKLYYALPYYEKPIFDEGGDFFNPTQAADNNFIIDLYDNNFEKIKTTKIPIVVPDDVLYSFPGMGLLRGNEDLSFGEFSNDGKPTYIIGAEKYLPTSDDFITDLFVYDWDGNKLYTFDTDIEDYQRLYDIPGQEQQYCFLHNDGYLPYFNMIDFPSMQQANRLELYLDDGNTITTAFDRTPVGKSYKYVSTLPTAESDDEGNALHVFAWFDDKANFDRYDKVNLGKNIATAMPYISGEAFDPFFFNTDSDVEYMLLVKEYTSKLSSATKELLRIYSASGEKVLELGPDQSNGQVLRDIFINNYDSDKAMLMVTYYNSRTSEMSLRHFRLPLNRFAGGDGTIDNPYVIATPGDLMSIQFKPSAHYVIGNDIDGKDQPIKGNNGEFLGTLDGAGHMLYNFNITNGAIFEQIGDKAQVKDIVIANSQLSAGEAQNVGFIAGIAMGQNPERFSSITNVHVYNSTIEAHSATAGGIVGNAWVYAAIEGCSVEDTEISGSNYSEIGGIAGRLQTSGTVHACAFSGTLQGGVVGGIVGDAGRSTGCVSNCHANADITATSTGGGIVGASERAPMWNNYAEGSIVAGRNAGGLVGQLDATYEDEPEIIISNNIVAVSAISTTAEDGIAHRIVGRSSGETYEIDWDNVKEGMDREDYPMIAGDPEPGLDLNYAIGLDPINSAMEGKNNLEGQTIAFSDIDEQFLSDGAWHIGNSYEMPWQQGEEALYLFFEGDEPKVPEPPVDGIESAIGDNNTLSYDGNLVHSPGNLIQAFNSNGVLAAQAYENLQVSALSPGLYIITDGNSSIKIIVR